jgi:tetratricopeptide (TPR) repeat protein
MKLGELLYRQGDFASARVELETLARKFPDSDYDEPALFLAAQSVSRIPTATAPDEAILLFEEVATGNGALAAQARLEQASLIAAQGNPLEANLVLDKILSSNPAAAMRAAARILESTQKWPEAIRVYETLAATDGPRSLEAKNRIKQLRLEHFLWDGE